MRRGAGPPSPTQGRDPREATRRVPGLWPAAPAAGAPDREALSLEKLATSRCGAHLCVSVSPQAGRMVRISSACGSVRGAVRASLRRARVGKASRNASGAEPRHPQCAAGSARRAPALRLIPPRAEEGPQRWRVYGASPSHPPKGDQVQLRKKNHQVFIFVFVFKEIEKPGESQFCSPPPPNPLVSSSDSSFPAGQRINTQINKPQSYLTPAHRSAYI